MMISKIIPLPIFEDNYVWIITDQSTKKTVVVDPGDAETVLHYLSQNKLTLSAILVTHHHFDHVGGVSELCNVCNVPVYGPANEAIPKLTYPLAEGQQVDLSDVSLKFEILDLPGHTLGHIAYYAANPGILFCGDTLFSAGCGRLFEGTAEMLLGSLSKLAALPSDTKVFCSHEYTLNNLKFAEKVEPKNTDIESYRLRVEQILADRRPSLPSTIGNEIKINPFLRCHNRDVRKAAENYAGKTLDSPIDVFATLRDWKDHF